MRFLSRARTTNGRLHSAKVQDTRGRVFYFCTLRGPIQQWVDHPVADENGYGDGYWRKAGKRDAATVRAFLEKWSQEGNLARTTFVNEPSIVKTH